MGTKNKPGVFDCYANAAPDEPMFILLGRDPMAPFLVKIWAEMRRVAGEDPAKIAEADVCALAMFAWSTSLGKDPVAASQALTQALININMGEGLARASTEAEREVYTDLPSGRG